MIAIAYQGYRVPYANGCPELTDAICNEKTNYFLLRHVSRDRKRFSPITHQGSIFTHGHVGFFGISVRKYVDRDSLCFEYPEAR